MPSTSQRLPPRAAMSGTGKWRPWWLGGAAGLVGIGLRALAQPALGDQLPFVVAFPATALAALLWGAGPGLLTAALCVLAVLTPWVPPGLASAGQPLQVGAFCVSAVATCLVCDQFRRRADDTPDPARQADTPLTLWLRAVLWGAVLIPAVVFAVACWWGYERAYREAEESVSHASALALRQAERTFEVAAEIGHLVADVVARPDAEIRARETEVHQRLRDMVVGLPSVVNLNVWDADGHALASSEIFPVDPTVSVADRGYFVALREGEGDDGALGISEVLTGRQTGRALLNASLRRTHGDGRFGGVIAVSLSPGFFADYYRSLANEEPHLASFAMVRTDGALLARWPPPDDGATAVPADHPALLRIRAGAEKGTLLLSGAGGREPRLMSFRRVGDYPVYVTAGVARAVVLDGWLRFVALLAAGMVPTTLGLVYVSWIALKKTRREQAVSVALRDEIARRAKAEQAMLQSQKLEALAQLTGGVAHDFNNLLTIVNTSLHVHRRNHPELRDERQLESMSRAIKSGVRLTRQLLSFSRRQALRPETVRLQQWLPAIEDLIRSTLGRGVALEIAVDADTAAITVDLAELELAVINTALNAHHAMPDGGTLRFSAANAQHAAFGAQTLVALRIADSGTGIPPALLLKVFEPFFTTKGPGKGSGLGLSQVYGLCAQAGGVATIERSSPEGTTIGMYFPAASEGAAASPPAVPGVIPALNGRVLLVEDNDDVALATEELLRSAGLSVVRAANADLALTLIQDASTPHDLVFSDISMPGTIDGIALAFTLRVRRPDLPVLLTTGYAERINDAIAAGFKVLSKPAAPEDLLGEIATLLAASRGPTAPA